MRLIERLSGVSWPLNIIIIIIISRRICVWEFYSNCKWIRRQTTHRHKTYVLSVIHSFIANNVDDDDDAFFFFFFFFHFVCMLDKMLWMWFPFTLCHQERPFHPKEDWIDYLLTHTHIYKCKVLFFSATFSPTLCRHTFSHTVCMRMCRPSDEDISSFYAQ